MRVTLPTAFWLSIPLWICATPISQALDDPAPPEPATLKDMPNPKGIPPSYMKRSDFYLPVLIHNQVRGNLREVALYVSVDHGKTYRVAETGGSDVKVFRFRAPRDGVYWFAVQTRDVNGRRRPRDVRNDDPGVIVCVDTKPPEVRLKAVPRRKGVGVEWTIRDANLDVKSLRLEYRAVGTEAWTALPAAASTAGRYAWDAPAGTPLEVRLTASDKAGNIGQQTIKITP